MASTMAAPRAAAAYDQDTFDAHNHAGPSWLRAWRADSFRAFESLPLPTTALEEWRYTDPKRLKWDRVRLAPDASTAAVPERQATLPMRGPCNHQGADPRVRTSGRLGRI